MEQLQINDIWHKEGMLYENASATIDAVTSRNVQCIL